VLPDDTLQKKRREVQYPPLKLTAHPAEWMVRRWNSFPFWGKKKQAYFSAGAQGTLSLEPKFLGRFGRTTNCIEDSKTMNPGSWIVVMEFSFQNSVLLSDCVLLKENYLWVPNKIVNVCQCTFEIFPTITSHILYLFLQQGWALSFTPLEEEICRVTGEKLPFATYAVRPKPHQSPDVSETCFV